eukprot:scaffold3618_cov129-Isochrysis_galbana.AAC.3
MAHAFLVFDLWSDYSDGLRVASARYRGSGGLLSYSYVCALYALHWEEEEWWDLRTLRGKGGLQFLWLARPSPLAGAVPS